ncbi:unnamed protein product [Owenia fusiformis]|uniref:Uncharacterized protein n=1 Tax=Owenia fusiformis TaxID=6347 RepID=A0A8J1TRY1_OWEFU|nr:unnamed protein product [Owenia fusiformis]
MYFTVFFLMLLGTAWCRLSGPKGRKGKDANDDIRLKGYCPTTYIAGDPNVPITYDIDPCNATLPQTPQCYFYQCERGEYEKFRCPDGLGVSSDFVCQYKKKGTGSNVNPCTVPFKDCTMSLEEKGLNDREIDVCGIDLVIAVDVSCSVESVDKIIMKQFITRVLKKLPIKPGQTQVAGYTFSKELKHITFLNEFNIKKEVIERFEKYSIDGKPCGTATYDAIEQARNVYFTEANGRRKNKKGIFLMMSDGFTNPPNRVNDTLAQIDKFKEEYPNVRRCVIGLDNIRQKELGNRGIDGSSEWSRLADPDCLFVETFDKLYERIYDITRKSCEKV